MARTNTNAELWKALSQFGMMDDSTAASKVNTTLSAAYAAGVSTIKIASAVGATALDYIRIGPSGVMEVAQLETNTTNPALVSKIAYAHASGETVKELTRTILGDLSDDGVQVEITADRTRIDAATRRHAYDHNINHTEYRVTVAMENLSDENVLTSLGIPESNRHGAGTAADPYVADATPANLDTINPVHFWCRGTLGNGNTVEVQMWDCRIDPSKSITFARGQDAPAQLVFNTQHIRWLNPVA
ncbi:MAG: hypothetical protein WC718_04355 [Phycisphaerales bacterium]|jgi:hypothetical protein